MAVLRSSRSIIFPLLTLTILFAALLLGTSGYSQRQEEEKPVNLKVLDSTISHDSLIAIMQNFTVALGVGCDFCHPHKDGGKSRDMDFATDSRHEKLIAREMLLMTHDINSKYMAASAHLDKPAIAVECITCHRGQPHPAQIDDVLTKARSERGMAGLDSTYRALRTKYYGSHTFDFSEHILVHLAFRLSEERAADAFTVLKLNEEFYPASAFNHWALGQLYIDQADTTSAIAEFKQALALNPSHRGAKRGLEALGVKIE